MVLVFQLQPQLADAGQQVLERGLVLQVAQSGRIRRRYIDGDIVGSAVNLFKSNAVIGQCLIDRRGQVFADIDAKHKIARGVADILQQPVDAIVIETHAVDQALLLVQPENTRQGIAWLRPGSDAAHFDKAKAEPGQAVEIVRVLVQAGSETDTVGKVEAHDADRAVDASPWNQRVQQLQHVQADVVRLFRIERKQQWFCQRVKHQLEVIKASNSG